MIKVLFQGEEIELNNEIEPGEKELDMLDNEKTGDTIELKYILEYMSEEVSNGTKE